MRNIEEFESFLNSGPVNERLKQSSANFIRKIASSLGEDPEAVLRMVQADLEEEGMSEAKIYEWIGGESVATLTDFFVMFPSIILALVGMSVGGAYLHGSSVNRQYIKTEAERLVTEMIKKDPSLLDRKDELIAMTVKKLKDDPELQASLKKETMSGGKVHPEIKKNRRRYSGNSHIFGGGY